MFINLVWKFRDFWDSLSIIFQKRKICFFPSKELEDWGEEAGRDLLSWGNISICWRFRISLARCEQGRSDHLLQLALSSQNCIFCLSACLFVFVFLSCSLFHFLNIPVEDYLYTYRHRRLISYKEDSSGTDFSLHRAESSVASPVVPVSALQGHTEHHQLLCPELSRSLNTLIMLSACLCLLLLLLFSCPVASDSCDPVDCSTPGLPVPHHPLEFAQIHVHCISDATLLSNSFQPLSYFPYQSFSPHPGHHYWTHQYLCIDHTVGPHTDQYFSSGVGNTEQKGPITSFVLLTMPLLMKSICVFLQSICTIQLTYVGLTINKNSWLGFC